MARVVLAVSGNLIMAGACGDCNACCTRPALPGKPDGVACPMLRDGGCSIYETRPGGCRRFRCAWLEGDMADDLRPDRSGVILALTSSPDLVQAYVMPGVTIGAPIAAEMQRRSETGRVMLMRAAP